MLSKVFLGMSLVGAEWVLYLLLLLSILSVALIIERVRFYRAATRELADFRKKIQTAADSGQWQKALDAASQRLSSQTHQGKGDFEAGVSQAVLQQLLGGSKGAVAPTEALNEAANSSVLRTRVLWEKNLAILATIGNNAPFVGLFGTVLGIIQAFHHLSQNATSGVHGVTAGIAEALIATAVGILVAIPAVVAFNLFQRRVRASLAEAEALKSYLIARIAGGGR